MKENCSKIKCVKSVGSFKEGNEYYCENRSFTNRDNKDDVQVIVIESSEEDMDNCYLVPLDKMYEHFSLVK